MEKIKAQGSKKAKIMFVADFPVKQELKKGKFGEGKASNLLRSSLEQLGIDAEEDCYFTGVIKHELDGGREVPNKEELQAGTEFLKAEIAVVKPDIIVPMDNIALKQILGRTGITKFRGKAQEKDDLIIMPIIHPSMLFTQPKYADNWVKDLENLKELTIKGKGFLEAADVEYRYLEEIGEVREEIERLMSAEFVVFDLETTGLNPYVEGAKIVCISLTDRDHYGVTIPLQHQEFEWDKGEFDEIIDLLKGLLEAPEVKIMAHNGKFDMKWVLAHYKIDVSNYSFDPMLAHYLAVSEERGGHGLKDLAWELTDMGGYDNELDDFKATLPEAIRHNYDNVPWEILRTYAAADVDCTFRLYKKFKKLLAKDKGWRYVLKNLLLPGSYALRDIEDNGVKIDEEVQKKFEAAYLERIEDIEVKLRRFPEIVEIEREKENLFKLRQVEMKKPKEERDEKILKYNKYKNFKFKFSSPVQLRELLFEKLGLKTPFLTDKGDLRKRHADENNLEFVPEISELSTGKETLEFLEGKHPISSLLSEWRRLDKTFGTYIRPAKEWVGVDGLVHPTFNLIGTVTGRLSSESPNAQNFPRKTNDPRAFEYNHGVKKLFVSRFGDQGIMLQSDFSQLELRIAAIFSGDERLLQAYRDGQDLHIYAASIALKKPIEEVSKDDRTKAKAVNFGLLYGKGKHSLAEDMKVDVEEAQKFIDAYFKEFKGMRKWLDRMEREVKQNKRVKTLTGRWRRLPGIDSNKRGIVGDAKRQAVNAPIQGTGSDITLVSIILLNYKMKKAKLKSKICMTVHDSIVIDVFLPELEEVYNLVLDTMQNPPFKWVNVPIVADIEIGRNYAEMVAVENYEDILKHESTFAFIDSGLEKQIEKDWEKVGGRD